MSPFRFIAALIKRHGVMFLSVFIIQELVSRKCPYLPPVAGRCRWFAMGDPLSREVAACCPLAVASVIYSLER